MTDDPIAQYKHLVQRASEGDTRPFIETLLRIQPKSGPVVPFKFNEVQNDYWDNRTEADIVLKPRQVGFSTLVQAEFYTDALVIPGLEVIYLAQREESAKRLFEITTRFHRNLPEQLRPKVTSDTTMKLSWDWPNGATSTIEIGTAKSKSFGRGRPVHRALFTEVGLYEEGEEETMLGIISAMPFHSQVGARFVEESTANGMSGIFFSDWMGAERGDQVEGLSFGLTQHFYPWFYLKEYAVPGPKITNYDESELRVIRLAKEQYGITLTDDQIRWRRMQVAFNKGEVFFLQEYPETPEQAFRNVGAAVFSIEDVMRAKEKSAGKPDYTSLVPGTDGRMHYWEYTIPRTRYIISVDQASGLNLDGDKRPTDYQVATVWDAALRKQVATLRGHITQSQFADLIYRLFTYYNYALVVVERNHAQYGSFDMLRDAGVTNLYYHYNDKKMGYPVNVGTKPALIDNMKEYLAADAVTVRSENLIAEMVNYRYQGGSIARQAAAGPGGHDDELMTAMFAMDPDVIQQAMIPHGPATIGSEGRPHYTSQGVPL